MKFDPKAFFAAMAGSILATILLAFLACDPHKTCTPDEVRNLVIQHQLLRADLEAIDPRDIAATQPALLRLIDVADKLAKCSPDLG